MTVILAHAKEADAPLSAVGYTHQRLKLADTSRRPKKLRDVCIETLVYNINVL